MTVLVATPLSTPFTRTRLPALAVWSATIAYALLATYFSLRRHDAFLSGFDVATFDQELWLLANGLEPLNTQLGISFWGEHFSLTITLLAPLYALGAGPATLLVIQAVTMAAVAPLLYSLARAYDGGTWQAALVALLWLASPLTLAANLYDVHHVPLVAPAIVGSIIALRYDRLLAFSILGLLACFAKEDVSLMYAMLGIVIMLEGRRRLGAAITIIAAGIFIVAMAVVLPSFSNIVHWQGERFAGSRGDSVTDAGVWMVVHPLETIGDLMTPQNVGVCAALIVVTGGLCLLAPRWILLGLPTLAFNFLSAYPTQHQLLTHYFVPVLIAFAIASAIGVQRLTLVRPAVRLALSACILTTFVASPFGLALAKDESEWSGTAIAQTGGPEARRSAIALIPKDVPVAATPRLSAHLSQRREIYTLPLPFLGREEVGADWSQEEMDARAEGVEWVIVDTVDRRNEFREVSELVLPLLPALGFREIFRQGTVVVYSRRQAARP